MQRWATNWLRCNEPVRAVANAVAGSEEVAASGNPAAIHPLAQRTCIGVRSPNERSNAGHLPRPTGGAGGHPHHLVGGYLPRSFLFPLICAGGQRFFEHLDSRFGDERPQLPNGDRKSTRLNSSHVKI